MEYVLKHKRLIIFTILLSLFITSIPTNLIVAETDLSATQAKPVGTSTPEDFLNKVTEESVKEQEKINKDMATHVDIDVHLVEGNMTNDIVDIVVTFEGHYVTSKKMTLTSYNNGTAQDIWDLLAKDVIAKIPQFTKGVSKEGILNLVADLIKRTDMGDGGEVIVVKETANSCTIKIKFKDGTTEEITITDQMSETAIKNEVNAAIQALADKLNQAINGFTGDITGDYTGGLFKDSIFPKIIPTGTDGTGAVTGWRNSKVGVDERKKLNEFKPYGAKDMHGEQVVFLAYGAPFGKMGNHYRFMGYSPQGYPLTNPFFPDDVTGNVQFWTRKKFKIPWANPELETKMKANRNAWRYRVNLEKIDKVDGIEELNPLIWMGLEFHWSNHVSASDEDKDWANHVKFQIPPTDDHWGTAYFPSEVNGGFRYVTIPIPPQSMLGIDIKTDTVISTPQIVTGNKVEIKTVYSIHNVKSAKDKEKFLNMDFDTTVKSPLFGEKKYS